jgi:hypothetical protein
MVTAQVPRSQVTRAAPSPGLGLSHTRSLTISNPDPTSPRSPRGHIRSKTIDSPRSTEYRKEDLPDYSFTGRPVRPKIVISSSGEWHPRGQSDRYPSFRDRSKLQPPSAYPSAKSALSRSNSQTRPSPDATRPRQPEYPSSNQPYSTPEILQTPNDQFAGLEIYDDYHSPTPIPDLVDDVELELPYTAIGQAFTGVSTIRPKQPLPIQRVLSRSRSNAGIQRSDTNQSRRGRGQGLLLTVEDQVQSPTTMDQDLVKIRIKVSSLHWTKLMIGPYRKTY